MNTGNPDFDLLPEWFWVLTVTLFGLAIGSFLNVVIYRVPIMYPDIDDDDDDDSETDKSGSNKENKENKEELSTGSIVSATKETLEENKVEKVIEEKTAEQKIEEEKAVERNPNLPPEEKISLTYPTRSFCPNCGHNITALENIPVISYLFLGGKCRGCKQGISIVYPFVEAMTAILFVLAFYHQASKPVFSIPDYVSNVIFISSIIALVFIDYNKMILPDVITLSGALLSLVLRIFVHNESPPTNTFLAVGLSTVILVVLALIIIMVIFDTRIVQLSLLALILLGFCLGLNWLMQDPERIYEIQTSFMILWHEKIIPYPSLNSLINGTLGAIVGAGSLMVVAGLYFVLRGIAGMGGGDFKMMLYVGMFLGWQLTFCTLLLAPALAMIPVFVILILKGNEAWQAKLPFGVFLGIGAILSLLYGREIIDGYILFSQKYLMPN